MTVWNEQVDDRAQKFRNAFNIESKSYVGCVGVFALFWTGICGCLSWTPATVLDRNAAQSSPLPSLACMFCLEYTCLPLSQARTH